MCPQSLRPQVLELLVLVVAVFAFHDSKIGAEDLAPSDVIENVIWAPADSVRRDGRGGDNWPITWADDDKLYTTYGDGWGFQPKVKQKLSMGYARIIGDANDWQGENIRSDDEELGDGRAGKKAWGILSIDGTLFLWIGHADRKGGQSQLAWSTDHAKTWTHADWKFAPFGLIGFVNFGKDYDGARDNYVYAYSHDGPRADQPADGFVLMRADKNRLVDRDAWEFFDRLDHDGEPVWTRNIEQRGVMLVRKDAALRSAMTYNAGLGRYLWWIQTPAPIGSNDRGDTRFQGGFAILDAPEPWGPWTVAYQTDQWDIGPGEHADFPAKWISADGKTLFLVFSGDDAFCVRQATLQLRE
tara:strand:+ start:151341 stop:152408 length:1068 start_codon:yes stop_codon:yes gene_type:complete